MSQSKAFWLFLVHIVREPKGTTQMKVLSLCLLAIFSSSCLTTNPKDTLSMKTKVDILMLSEDLKTFKKECGRFPSAQNWYQELASDSCLESVRKKDVPVLHSRYSREPEDSWHRPIQYTLKDGKSTLQSLGKDGVPGGSGENEDIVLEVEP